jgi:lipid-binding SYLF domain-containing protein
MVRFNVRLTLGAVLAALLLAMAPRVQANETQLMTEAARTIALYQKADPGITRFFEKAAGYAVFPSVAKGAVGIGGAHGDGIVYERGRPVGKASLTQVTIGAQLGGQELSQVIFFETPQALATFKQSKMAMSAQVSAVALKSGASANAKYQDGVAVFTATKGGLMAEASVGGQKFTFEPFVTQ